MTLLIMKSIRYTYYNGLTIKRMQYLKRANRLIVAAKRPLILEKKLMWLLQFSKERITLILCKAVFKELLTEKFKKNFIASR
jgi:hypothetical protein